MFAVLLALLSSMSFGLSQIWVRKHIEKSNPLYVSLTVTIMGNLILWPLALYYTDLTAINTEGFLLFVAAGFLAPGIARLFYFKGMKTAGINANASIFSTYPLYTTIAAVLVLGETLTPENWAGLILIVTGAILVGRLTSNSHTTTSTKKGLIVPILGSLFIAFSQIVRKEALNIYSQPILGVAIGYTASMLVYLAVMAFSKTSGSRKFSRQDLQMFWKPGIGIAAGWLFSFFALSQEMVSIVVPLLQTELLFILFFSYLFLQKIEKTSPKLVVSAILIILGVVLIGIN